MKILLDANFLLAQPQFNVDIYSLLLEFGSPPFFTLEAVVKELEKLASEKGKQSRQARFALLQLKREGVQVIPSEGYADSALLETAKKGFRVCTQDAALIKKLKSARVKVITIRQKKRLEEV